MSLESQEPGGGRWTEENYVDCPERERERDLRAVKKVFWSAEKEALKRYWKGKKREFPVDFATAKGCKRGSL